MNPRPEALITLLERNNLQQEQKNGAWRRIPLNQKEGNLHETRTKDKIMESLINDWA
jgi:hypothetical protein